MSGEKLDLSHRELGARAGHSALEGQEDVISLCRSPGLRGKRCCVSAWRNRCMGARVRALTPAWTARKDVLHTVPGHGLTELSAGGTSLYPNN